MIKIENVSFRYPSRKEYAIKDINLHIKKGEFVVLTGISGCGKTTLLKALNGIIPHESTGEFNGNILIDGLNTRENSITSLSQKIGLLFQNPDEQIFSTRVLEEVAFGMENLCFKKEEILKRVEWALGTVNMKEYITSSTSALSGGQKQRVALASVMALKPDIFVLDEPISQLDPQGAKEVLKVIKNLKDNGMTILMVEHRIHEVAKWSDRIIIMDKGKIIKNINKNDIDDNLDIFDEIGIRSPKSGNVDFSNNFHDTYVENREMYTKIIEKEKVIEIKDLWFSYDDKRKRKNKKWILNGINLEIYEGEITAILGCNGSGKSTLMNHIAGIFKPHKGYVKVEDKDTKKYNAYKLAGTVGIVFQNPSLMLTCDSVYDEIAFGPKNLKLSKDKIKYNVNKCLNTMELTEYSKVHPQTLSGGQRLRCAAASIISMEPKVILLDEPTSGQDYFHIKRLMEWCIDLKKCGTTIVFITHDFEIAEKYSDRIAFMENGNIIKDVHKYQEN